MCQAAVTQELCWLCYTALLRHPRLFAQQLCHWTPLSESTRVCGNPCVFFRARTLGVVTSSSQAAVARSSARGQSAEGCLGLCDGISSSVEQQQVGFLSCCSCRGSTTPKSMKEGSLRSSRARTCSTTGPFFL